MNAFGQAPERVLINWFITPNRAMEKALKWPRYSKKEDFAVIKTMFADDSSTVTLGYDEEEGLRFECFGRKGVEAVVKYIASVYKTFGKPKNKGLVHAVVTTESAIKGESDKDCEQRLLSDRFTWSEKDSCFIW